MPPPKLNTIIGRQYSTWSNANRAINHWLRKHPERNQNGYWANQIDEGGIIIEANQSEIKEFGEITR